MLDVCLLGTGGMMPLPRRKLTALMTRYNGSNLMIDCGEGTQVAVKEKGWSFKPIDVICFTHYHADHISGLPGLLLTMGNAERTEPFTLYGYEITAYKVNHNVLCYGYTIEIKRNGKFDAKRAKEQNIPLKYWNPLQKGETVEADGMLYTPDMVLGPARKGIKLTYTTDTRPVKSIEEHAKDSDLFICEGMYGEQDKEEEKAKAHKHMTFKEAATLAKSANVKELWLTHYSPSLVRPEEALGEATKIFQNTIAARDRQSVELQFEEE